MLDVKYTIILWEYSAMPMIWVFYVQPCLGKISTCEHYASGFNITLNGSKSELMCFSKSPSINLNNMLYMKDGSVIEQYMNVNILAIYYFQIYHVKI